MLLQHCERNGCFTQSHNYQSDLAACTFPTGDNVYAHSNRVYRMTVSGEGIYM